jgi:hypothetical protein
MVVVVRLCWPYTSRVWIVERVQKRAPTEAVGGILVGNRKAKWKFRLNIEEAFSR